MAIIPVFFNRDDYLQNPIMRRFLKERELEFVENRADYIKAIEEYAAQDKSNEKEVREWLLKIVKEGSKDFCYKKIYRIEAWHQDPVLVKEKIKEFFPDCPQESILDYKSTGDPVMIDYDIIVNEEGEVSKIEFTFSQLFLFGDVSKEGDVTTFPVFVEIYLDEGFLVSRAKAKSTLFQYDEVNRMLYGEYRVDTMDYAVSLIDNIVNLFGFVVEKDKKKVINKNSKMLFKIYEKYSFTPKDVAKKIEKEENLLNDFVNQVFTDLCLDVGNKPKAILDAKIFVEKFISINGNNEEIFKVDRPAYLIKVTADDEIELTRIDTTSNKTVPLQCTEAFFDSKKSVIKNKKCKRLNLIFKRNDETYFLRKNPLVIQMGTQGKYGYLKTMQYAEEVDIQNVLQAVFNNY